jgi:GNAT superfamily N-acetyltransferase
MRSVDVTIRPAALSDVADIARVWHVGWRYRHRGHVPAELVAAHTLTSFVVRAREHVDITAVAIVDGAVVGFVMVVGDEVEQVYVAAEHRGGAAAGALLAEAERRVSDGGHPEAWLAIVAGNTRAGRFCERQGWTDDGLFDHTAAGGNGPVTLPSRRYVKRVT